MGSNHISPSTTPAAFRGPVAQPTLKAWREYPSDARVVVEAERMLMAIWPSPLRESPRRRRLVGLHLNRVPGQFEQSAWGDDLELQSILAYSAIHSSERFALVWDYHDYEQTTYRGVLTVTLQDGRFGVPVFSNIGLDPKHVTQIQKHVAERIAEESPPKTESRLTKKMETTMTDVFDGEDEVEDSDEEVEDDEDLGTVGDINDFHMPPAWASREPTHIVAVGYLRSSLSSDRTPLTSLNAAIESQLTAFAGWVLRTGGIIHSIVVEPFVSGPMPLDQRPGYQKALDQLHRLDTHDDDVYLLVSDKTRLARRQSIYQEASDQLLEMEVHVADASEVDDGEEHAPLLVATRTWCDDPASSLSKETQRTACRTFLEKVWKGLKVKASQRVDYEDAADLLQAVEQSIGENEFLQERFQNGQVTPMLVANADVLAATRSQQQLVRVELWRRFGIHVIEADTILDKIRSLLPASFYAMPPKSTLLSVVDGKNDIFDITSRSDLSDAEKEQAIRRMLDHWRSGLTSSPSGSDPLTTDQRCSPGTVSSSSLSHETPEQFLERLRLFQQQMAHAEAALNRRIPMPTIPSSASTPSDDPTIGGGPAAAPSRVQAALTTVRSDAVDAAWRTAATQLVKMTRDPLVGVLSRHLGPDDEAMRKKIADFLATEAGTALLSGVLSVGLSAMPNVGGAGMQAHSLRMARELRVKSMADLGDVVADVLMGPLRQVMALYLQGLPPELMVEEPAPALLSAAPATSALGDVAEQADGAKVGAVRGAR